jgi:hypothetical protein
MFGADPLAVDNRDYQGRLAASLIGALGIERALETCLSNGWDGVLQQVLGHRTPSLDLAKSPSRVK